MTFRNKSAAEGWWLESFNCWPETVLPKSMSESLVAERIGFVFYLKKLWKTWSVFYSSERISIFWESQSKNESYGSENSIFYKLYDSLMLVFWSFWLTNKLFAIIVYSQ